MQLVPYTFGHAEITISIDILQMHDGVSITPHTVPLSCHAFHYCTAEDGVLIAKTKMSNRGMITACLPSFTALNLVRCSNKVHNQENISARVYHLASEHVR